MLKCPVCSVDLEKLSVFPDACPGCGFKLTRPGTESASVQLISDSGEPRNAENEATWQADEDSPLPAAGKSEDAADDPSNSKTFVSDEWDDPISQEGAAAQKSGSGDSNQGPVEERASLQLISDSGEPPRAEFDATMQSNEASLLPGGGKSESADDDPNNSKTFVSDEWDNEDNSKTVQSGEFDESSGSVAGNPEAAAGVDKTVQFDESDDPSIVKTMQSDEFALDDAKLNDRTMISDEWGTPAGGDMADRTLMSDNVPADAIKTMQSNWSGAFDGKTTPGTSIKGKAHREDQGKSTLVIKPRSMRSPDEQKPSGFAAEYELIKILGEGGMGVVYDAKQMSVDRSVAVKMLKAKTAGDEKQRQKFLAEAVVTGELDHPNIVPIYDVGTSDRGLLFYSMKKVKGTPWMKVVTKKPIPENLEILMKISDAVAFAHSRGVIHRDLKPENIMLGDYGEVLVMDWGLALPAPGYAKSDTIATSHSMGGTPAYMAPEMASGPLDKITFASDIYLLGAMLYEILTGRAPHTGKNTMQCLFAAAKNEIRPPENDKEGGELMDIAMKAMATEPKDRYPTVADFQQALRDYRMHIESIVLSTRAAEELEHGTQTGDYNAFNRARFGFEEAVKQWDGNTRAKTGLSETLIGYATSALKKGDFDLGASLLDADNPKHRPILEKLRKAQHDRESKQRTLKIMKIGAVVAGVAFVTVVSVALVLVLEQKKQADIAKADAIKQKDKAVEAEEEAVKQEKVATKAKDDAIIAQNEAIKQKTEAESQKMQAENARKQAVDAERKQAYEAYIAQIGLAAAKIEENAFDSAREILKGCDKDERNWEWRRLSYLCGLSEREVDAEQPIDAVAFSKDGKKFITGGWNRSAKIWETATGKLLVTLPVGGLFVDSVAFSPDGRTVAIGGNDKKGFIRIWNIASGKPETTPDGFKGPPDDELKDGVLSVTFSRDGSKLLTSSYDKTARLWDVKSGRQLQIYKGHSWFVWSAAFSPDESQIVTASQDGSVIIWNTESATRLKQFLEHQGPVYSAAFAPDGKHVVTGGYDKKVLVWQPRDVPAFNLRKLAAKGVKSEEGKVQAADEEDKNTEVDRVPVLSLEGHGGPVRSVSFSADGKLVLSGSHDNSVKVWDAETGKTLKTLHGHGSWVRACRFSPDDRIVLSASHDKKAMLWNIADYRELRVLGRVLQGHGDAVLAASFDQAGDSIVTASRDRTARTWDFSTGAASRTFREGHELLASNAVFFRDGKQVLTAAVDNTVRFWDVTSGTQIARLDKTGRAAALALAPSGKRILTGSDEKTAKLWDAETKELIKELKESHKSKYEVTAVAISPDEKWLLTADANGRGILWNAETLEVTHRLQSHTGKVTAAIFLPDSSRLLTASSDKTVAQWDVASGKEILPKVLTHPDAVVALALVPSRHSGARQALTSCTDGKVRLWDLEKAQVVGTLSMPSDEMVNAVAASSDGRLALTVQSDEKVKVVRLWDLEALREIKVPQGKDLLGAFLDFSSTRGIQLSTAIFSPDGDSVLTVGGNEARLWDRQKASELISFSPNGIVAAAGFSPDASRIVTGSWDNAARVWDAKTGVSILKLEGHDSAVNSAVYSPDGTLILTSSNDRTAMLWEAATGKLVRKLKGHTDQVRSAVFSADGNQILTASNDKTARLWLTETAQEVGRFEGHKSTVMSAVFSADGKKIVTGSEDNTARVWDIETRKMLLSLEGHTAPVASVVFLPDGQRVLTGSQDNTAKLWDAVTGKEVLTLKGHVREVTCVNVSKNGRYVITGSRDGTAIVWLATDSTTDAPQTANRSERN